ncbi:unnamed protein product [Mytilus edulis]|uniref:B box-type domain-containing protein n=1 Tax=Mytilus edulis TaxID=6550 RepID=A0A8S3R0V2_MYTED|nr:unnamed protein product [Mytilus edulis]
MASNWSVCGVCDYRHITKPSVVWCSECDEGLCDECKDHHSISKGTRNHDTVSITTYQKLPNETSNKPGRQFGVNQEKSREIEKEVLETRTRINLHLDTLQGAILMDLKTREEEESNKIRRILKSMRDKEKEIAKHQTNIGNIKQYAPELQTFFALKHIEKDVVAEEEYIHSILKRDGANQIDISYKNNPSLQGLLSAIQKFGDVVVTADSCTIPLLKQKDRQAQMMVAVTPLTINSLTPTLQQTLDSNQIIATGCSFLPDCKIVLASLAKETIEVFKPDGSLDFDIGNFGQVFDVTFIRENTVAVTSGYEKDCIQINLIILKTRKVRKTLKVNSV